jgi:hypothetical protein
MATLSNSIGVALAGTLATQLTSSTLVLTGTGLSIPVGGTITVSNGGTTKASAQGTPLTGTAPNGGTMTAFDFGPGKITGTAGSSNADLIISPATVNTGQGVSITAFEVTVETVL